jgi:PKD repeat protein
MRAAKLFSKSRTISLVIGLILVILVLPGAVSAASAVSARYVSSSIPSDMTAGQSYTVAVTMKNTGTMTWNEGSMIRLGGIGDGAGDAAKFGTARIKIAPGKSVLPEEQYTFTFTMRAPLTAGSYTPKYRMVWEGHQWFGSRVSKSVDVERGSVSAAPVSSAVNAQVVSSTIPPSMNAGLSYPVSVTMKNTGSIAWDETSMIRLGGVGDGTGDARQFGPSRICLPAGTRVPPGSNYIFTFTMTAPATSRTYSPQYQMVWEGHQWFGSPTLQKVQVLGTSGSTEVNPAGSSGVIPAAQFSSNTRQGKYPLTVQFTDQSVSAGTTLYKWDINNDGVTDYTTKNPSHKYTTPGNYAVKLTVTNAAGSDTEVKTNYIMVTSTAITPGPTVQPTISPTGVPVAQFTVSSMQGQYPLMVQFTDLSASTGTTSYQWDMNNDGVVDSTIKNPTYTYQTPGTYSVRLTVTNAKGSDTEIKTNYITVSSSPILTGNCFGAEACNPTGNPIGGGSGYTRSIAGTEASVKYSVSTKAELLTALKSAKAGETVFVRGNAVIDMTGTPSVTIPAGVTLASDRGRAGSAGALLKRTKNLNGGWEEPMFIAGGDYVRVTGLRLQGEQYPQDYGNDDVYDGSISERYYLVGIYAENRKGFEVDNCEMYGWAWSCVSLRQNSAAPIPYIHHNYIHHNQARGEGYGVNLYGGNALIEANIFDYNRHAITGAGHAGEKYEARYNIVLGNGDAIGGHHFDVHQDEDGGDFAGDKYLIHHNTFRKATDGGNLLASVAIRQRPTTGMYVYNNLFEAVSTETEDGVPIWERDSTQNMFATNNKWMGKIYPSNSGIVWFL